MVTENVNKSITVIGCGNMGRALIEGFLRKSSSITACDTNQATLDKLKSELSIFTTSDTKLACSRSKTIVVAVKPQAISELLETLKGNLDDDTHLISVAAGVTTQTFRDSLGDHIAITRVMPNLPALIGEGVSGIYSDSPSRAEETQRLFSTVGKCFLLSKESDLNTITGLSGSGPAFVCYFIEALSKGAVELGLEKETALEIAIQTVLGTALYLNQIGVDPAQLREMVSSPGGTTLEGLEILKNQDVGEKIAMAVTSATKRAQELASQQ